MVDEAEVDSSVAHRPPLKWAGGKRWLVPYLGGLWNKLRNSPESVSGGEHHDRRLVEPFCGGLAITLGLRPDRALLNDINPHAINFYHCLKRGFTVEREIEFGNESKLYYRNRARFNGLIADGESSTAEAAALFYYLNRTGYNGLCRFNNKGLFNVPFGKYRRINYSRDFTAYRRAFANWSFTSGDFEDVPIGDRDFIYADPPYDVEFTQYSQGGFGWDDQVRLAQWLAEKDCPAVLSNPATARIVRLYQSLGFTLEFMPAPRMINRTGDRTPAREVIATRGFMSDRRRRY